MRKGAGVANAAVEDGGEDAHEAVFGPGEVGQRDGALVELAVEELRGRLGAGPRCDK